MRILGVLALFASLSFVGGAPKDDNAKTAPTDVDGTWIVESIKRKGVHDNEEVRYTFTGDTFLLEITEKDGKKMSYRGRLVVHGEKEPKQITISLTEYMPVLSHYGIYRFERDRLVICWPAKGGIDVGPNDRPKKFDSKDGALCVLRRKGKDD